MKKLKENFIFDAVYQLLIMVIPLITTPYVARVIGVKGVGIYSYTYSIVNYFMMFALLGMNHYGNREISKTKDDKEMMNKTFSSIYALQLIVTSITMLCYLGYIFIFAKEYFIIQLIQSIYVLSVAFDINWFFCGLQEFKLAVTRSAIIKLLTLFSILLFVKNKNDLIIYISILALSTFFNQLILWPFIRGRVKFTKVSRNEIKRHIKPTLILFIPVIATSIYKVMDKIMIGSIINVNQVGYYENCEKLLNVVLTFVSVLGTVTLPEMAYLYKKGEHKKFYKIFNLSIRYLQFFCIPAIFGLIIISKSLIGIYLGNEFMPATNILRILCLSLFFTPVANIVRMQLLIPRGRDKEYIISIVVGAILNLFLNFLLIPRLYAVGAAIATVVAEMTVFCFHCYYVRKEIDLKKMFLDSLGFFIKGIIMFALLIIINYFIRNNILSMIISVLMGMIVYSILNISFIKDNILRRKVK